MNKHEDRIKKNRIIRRRNSIIIGILFLCAFGWAFFVGTKVASKKHAVVTASNKIEQQKSAEKKQQDEIKERFTTKQPAGAYMPWKTKRTDGKKVAYLTFDDGPSPNTLKILSILKQNNIKATFFLIGQNAERNKDLVKEEVKEGHVVGNHTYSHELRYREDPSVFVDDINRCNTVIKSIVGKNYNLKLMRFPGGSFNTRHLNLNPFKEAVTKAGYHYVDWNDWIGDAMRNNVPVDVLLNELRKYSNDNTVVVLMHDAATKGTTVQALPEVIQYLKSKGYTFDTLK